MFAWLEKYGVAKWAGKLIRKALAVLGGYLIAKYGLDEQLVNGAIDKIAELLIAVLPIIIAQLWSMKAEIAKK